MYLYNFRNVDLKLCSIFLILFEIFLNVVLKYYLKMAFLVGILIFKFNVFFLFFFKFVGKNFKYYNFKNLFGIFIY